MEQTMIMVMQTVQTFAEKSKICTLTEYEALMYEQCCNMAATFARIQDTIGRLQHLEAEKAYRVKQAEFNQWEKESPKSRRSTWR